MDTVKLKLNRTNGLLAKLRHYVGPTLLRTIYYAIFEPHVCGMDVNLGPSTNTSLTKYWKNPKQSPTNFKFLKTHGNQ